jgi:hypothetical protein
MVSKKAHNQEKISSILNRCLELIESGAGTVETVIDLYPDLDQVLRPPLEAAQWLVSRSEVLNPRPGFVKLSRQRLVDRFQGAADYADPYATPLSKLAAVFKQRRLVIQYSALFTFTAILLFVGFSSTGFLVHRSIPGDPLYEVKLAAEDTRIAISRSQVGDAYLRIEFAQRRVIEMQELILAGREEYLEETLINFEYQVYGAATAITSVAETDQESAAEITEFFAATVSVPMNNLISMLDSSPDLAPTRFVSLLSAVATGMNDLGPFEMMLLTGPLASTQTSSANATLTAVFTTTFTPTFSASLTFTPTDVVFATSTATVASVQENPPTAEPSPSSPPPKSEPTLTSTLQPSFTPSPPTITPSPTDVPTHTPTLEPSSTPDQGPTDTPTPDGGGTGPTETPTQKPKPSPRPTNTHRPTEKPTQEN